MADRAVEWIEDPAELARALSVAGDGRLAVDSEADSLHHYPEKVCLIQLTLADRDLLYDPLVGGAPTPLAEPLADPALLKILHGADYDIRVLRRDFDLRLRNLFDTMIAARLVGERAFGLASLLDRHLGVRLDKRFQRADWSRRPLTAAMRDYAALDTRHLRALADLLAERLEALGRRDWADEEFALLEELDWNPTPPEEAYRRVKGGHKLSPQRLAVLRELCALRERVARERDRPPFQILRDELLVELTREPGLDPRELRGLPRPWRAPARVERLRETLERGWATPRDDWPAARVPKRRERRPAASDGLKELSRRRDRVAEELDLEPSVIAPRALLEGLIERREAEEPIDGLPALRRWQAALLEPLLEGL